ncbi:MAG: hypothetical protein QXK52_06075 [Candidatus Bathyarchaeia archaeon]
MSYCGRENSTGFPTTNHTLHAIPYQSLRIILGADLIPPAATVSNRIRSQDMTKEKAPQYPESRNNVKRSAMHLSAFGGVIHLLGNDTIMIESGSPKSIRIARTS